MKLLPGEETVLSSNSNKVILTNHRIQLTDKRWGKSYTISIFLEDISSIETKFRSSPLLLVLAVLSVIVSIFLVMNNVDDGIPSETVGTVVLGICLLLAWVSSRRHIISIKSNGGSALNFLIKGMSKNNVEDFIYKVSEAKQNRVKQLYKL